MRANVGQFRLQDSTGKQRGGNEESSFVTKELPASLLPLLRSFLKEAEAWLVQNQAASFRDHLLELYFKVTSFVRTAESYDARYVTIVGMTPLNRLKLFCLDPSHLIQQALKRGNAAVFFSGTLTPMPQGTLSLGERPATILSRVLPGTSAGTSLNVSSTE